MSAVTSLHTQKRSSLLGFKTIFGGSETVDPELTRQKQEFKKWLKIDRRKRASSSMLHFACERDYTLLLEHAIEKTAGVKVLSKTNPQPNVSPKQRAKKPLSNIIDDNGKSALLVAVERGHKSCVDVIIGLEDLFFPDEISAAVVSATRCHHSSILSVLLASKAAIAFYIEFNHDRDGTWIETLKRRRYECDSSCLWLIGESLGRKNYGSSLIILDFIEKHEQNLRSKGSVYSNIRDNEYFNSFLWTLLEDPDPSPGYEEVFTRLINRGASTATIFFNRRNLARLIETKDTAFLPVLLKCCGIPKQNLLRKLLVFSIEKRAEHFLRVLLEHDDQPNSPNPEDPGGNVPIFLAVEAQQESMVELLLRYPEGMETMNGKGHTLLGVAAGHKNTAILRSLVSYDVNLLNLKDVEGNTPLTKAVQAGNKRIICWLLDAGATIDVTNKAGDTSLHHAARQGDKYIAQLLIESNASCSFKNSSGNFPIHTAATMGNAEVFMHLLKHDSSMMKGEGLDRLFRIVATREFDRKFFGPDVFLEVMKLGPSVDKPILGTDGETALLFSARKGWASRISSLLGRGADINRKNNKGHSAMTLALDGNHWEVAKCLRDRGIGMSIHNLMRYNAMKEKHQAKENHELLVKRQEQERNRPRFFNRYDECELLGIPRTERNLYQVIDRFNFVTQLLQRSDRELFKLRTMSDGQLAEFDEETRHIYNNFLYEVDPHDRETLLDRLLGPGRRYFRDPEG